MKKRTVTVLCAGVSSTGLGIAQGEVGLGAATGTMNVKPSTVEAGGSYVISNDPSSPCLLGEVSGDTGGVRPGAWFVEPDVSGNWSVTIDVPESGPPDAMGNPTPFPVGEYDQHALCRTPLGPAGSAAAAGPGEFTYEPATVTVVAPAQEEPTTPTPTTPSASPAAEAAAAEPSFTG